MHKIIKKLTVFCLALLFGTSCLFAVGVAPENVPAPDPTSTQITVGEQFEAEPQVAPSQEVNYVEESELTRKMLQAKKAENAKTYDSFGGGITIIAMCIVVGALIVLSILFYIFGNISSWFTSHKHKQTSKSLDPEKAAVAKENYTNTGDVIAAISAALAQHFATDHDMEDTILTIKRMRKAYSPWNSKIYNMRHEPEVVKTPRPKK